MYHLDIEEKNRHIKKDRLLKDDLFLILFKKE